MIRDIILTAEKLEDKPVNYDDLNTDVIVSFENGDQYVATFFSQKNLKKVIEDDQRSSELSAGPYYRLLNMVLVKNFNSGNLRPVIDCMIAEGDFQLIFKKL